MSEFDVRNNKNIDKIRFADVTNDDCLATRLIKSNIGFIVEEDEGDVTGHAWVRDREHANALIAAIEKAKELNWV